MTSHRSSAYLMVIVAIVLDLVLLSNPAQARFGGFGGGGFGGGGFGGGGFGGGCK
jgi:uncharacterized membrane protein